MRDNDGDRVVEKIFGVVSGGRANDCMKRDLSFNVDVSRFRGWIEKADAGRLSSAMCGAPLYARKGDEPRRATIALDAANAGVALSLVVPADAQGLRVLNAGDNGSGANAYDLEVSDGARGPTGCRKDARAQDSFPSARCPSRAPVNGWST